MDQNEKNLEYLNHFLRNNVQIIQGCFKQIEKSLRGMNDAVIEFQKTLSKDADEPE